MVLTDINNYSYICDNYPKDQFISIIKEFFFEGAKVISKYGGLIYKFVGDEAIYYFKDEDHRNSVAVALSAAAELNSVADKINNKYIDVVPYQLNIKSALSHGSVTVDSLIDTFELFGTNIIESSRILSEIETKNKNTIFYSEPIKKKIDFISKSKEEKDTILKGIKGLFKLYSYEKHEELSDLLLNINEETIEKLYYYRKEEEITEILEYLNENFVDMELNLFLGITNLFKRFYLPDTEDSIKAEYKELIQNILGKYKETFSKKYIYFLSSTIMTSIHLISKNAWDEEISEMFKTYLNFSDKRVIANTLDVFVHFDASSEDFLFDNLLKHENNRILANVLVKEGFKELGSKVIKEIQKMIDNNNPYFISSGLYAAGEIALHYKKTDLVYFNTNTEFLKILGTLDQFVTHENEMVRRQALKAAKKTDDELLNKKIMKIYDSTISQIIKGNIDQYFLEKIPSEEIRAA